MAKEFSFDVVSEPDLSEVQNALDQTRREVANRYDFRGQEIEVDFDGKALTITLDAPSGMVSDALIAVVSEKMARRNVSLRYLDIGAPELHGMNRAKVVITIKKGIETAKAKEIQKAVKASGIKVDTQIQGEGIRVSAKNKDDLQKTIQLLKTQDFDIELGFQNYR